MTASEERKFLIIDNNDTGWFVNATDDKQAVEKYAESVAISIKRDLFDKMIKHLNAGEIIELFNEVCIGKTDRIKGLLSDFQEVYKKE